MSSLAFKQDIVTAVDNPHLIADPFFRDCSVPRQQNGQPIFYSGGFSVVFPLDKDNVRWAFKVWSEEILNIRERYISIKAHLEDVKLPYFLDFVYVENGLIVEDGCLDTCRMKWVYSNSLIDYLSANLYDSQSLKALSDKFLEMTVRLHDAMVSHGDLHSQNIYVAEDLSILLIDYDSLCVPNLVGTPSVGRGMRGYQHPCRLFAGYTSSQKVDYFSELVIYLSILALAENPLLWDKYNIREAEYRLLFRPEDFLYFKSQEIYRDLMQLSPSVTKLVATLEGYLEAHLYLEPLTLFI